MCKAYHSLTVQRMASTYGRVEDPNADFSISDSVSDNDLGNGTSINLQGQSSDGFRTLAGKLAGRQFDFTQAGNALEGP